MPKPLIVLDHHFLSASKTFLINHFRALKAVGYQKILFEMNQEISFEDFKRQMNSMAKMGRTGGTVDQLVDSMSDLLNAIEAHGFDCEFIDPEPLAVAQSFDSALRQVKTKLEFERVRLLREKATYERDIYMAERVLAESKRLAGGVITFVGFKHMELLKRLTASGLEHVALVVDNSKDRRLEVLPGVAGLEHGEWLMMMDQAFRFAHYGQSVAYLDWDKAKKTPFFALKTELGLSSESDCHHRSLVADAVSPDSELKVDEFYQLQAYLPKSQQATIEARFPGLCFFQTEDKLCIPGINLGEQQEKITHSKS